MEGVGIGCVSFVSGAAFGAGALSLLPTSGGATSARRPRHLHLSVRAWPTIRAHRMRAVSIFRGRDSFAARPLRRCCQWHVSVSVCCAGEGVCVRPSSQVRPKWIFVSCARRVVVYVLGVFRKSVYVERGCMWLTQHIYAHHCGWRGREAPYCARAAGPEPTPRRAALGGHMGEKKV